MVQTVARTIAMIGNPNSGKTTLFNGLTGSKQRIGNWPGVTVERMQGHYSSLDRTIAVVDLPGTYALEAESEDEKVARDYLLENRDAVVVNVIDATNLERNLYLTVQLLELGRPFIIVLTMIDRAEAHGIDIDIQHLAHHLGVPVVAVNGHDERDMMRLRRVLADLEPAPASAPNRVQFPEEIENVAASWTARFSKLAEEHHVPAHWIAIKALEHDVDVFNWLKGTQTMRVDDLDQTRIALTDQIGDDLDIAIADARFGFIHGITRDVVRRKLTRRSFTERIDTFVMNRYLGVPVFLAAMFAVFWVTIEFAGAFIEFFDILGGAVFVEGSARMLDLIGAPGWVHRIVSAGIGAGLQTVATFVPIIAGMFLMLSVLESSGYMARAAFVMDKLMRSIGLSGKAFVPLVVGFGCTVPAIAATRTLETRKDRLMTAFIAPLMSCGARLPVYALFVATFFSAYSGVVVFSLYLIGIVMAILTGLLLKWTLFPGEGAHFVMELPPYHVPSVRNLVQYTWNRLRMFIGNAGVTITVAVTLLSVLNTIPVGHGEMRRSALEWVGRTVTPVFAPIGVEDDNWPATVGLFTGLFAKEAIIGTLYSLYLDEGGPAETDEMPYGVYLQGRIVEAVRSAGAGIRALFSRQGGEDAQQGLSALRGYFSPAAAYAYLVFVLLYIPCLAAMGAAVVELGPKLGTVLAVYLTAGAWAVATLFYQVAEGHSPVLAFSAAGVLALLVAWFRFMGRRA